MKNLVEISGLKKYFETAGGLLHAVDDVSFEIPQGSTLGVVGESGCGKSTLGRLVIHLLEPTDGKILFYGEDITRPSRKDLSKLRQRMQMIFQDPYSSVNPRMTVSEIIAEPLVISGKFSKPEIAEKVDFFMNKVGLASRLHMSYPHELDGGRRQRISVARALAIGPEFIVCDEPVSALDVSIQAQILNLLLDLQDEMNLTYMFITHDLSVVKYISHSIIVMYLGQIVEKGPSEAIFAHPVHPYTQALLSAVPVADIHHKRNRILLKGELSSPVNPKPGCRFAVRCPYASERCHIENPVMHEVSSGHFVTCHLCDGR